MSSLYHLWHNGEVVASYNSIGKACDHAVRGGLGSREGDELAAGDTIKGWRVTIGKTSDPERKQPTTWQRR